MFGTTLVLYFPLPFLVVKKEVLTDNELLLVLVRIFWTILVFVKQNLLVIDGAIQDQLIEVTIKRVLVVFQGVLEILAVAFGPVIAVLHAVI